MAEDVGRDVLHVLRGHVVAALQEGPGLGGEGQLEGARDPVDGDVGGAHTGLGQPALDAWERDSLPPPGWRVDPDALIGNWQETFAELRDQPGDHLIVTSNGIARFALAAAGVRHHDAKLKDPKLKTGAWGVVEVKGQDVSVLAWNVRPHDA